MSADNVLQKRYNNFLGLDLKSTDLVRPIEFASDILNAHYTKTGTIQKRVGYQSRAGSIGGSGLFVYAKIDPVTSKEAPEVVSLTSDLSRLTEATIYLNGDINTVLDNFSIIKEGFTHKDLRVLKYITQNEKGVGLQGLASYLDTSAENFCFEIEPYLLKNHLIMRTPRGRRITNSGVEFIKELEAELAKKKMLH